MARIRSRLRAPSGLAFFSSGSSVVLCNCVSSGYLGVVIVRGGVTVAKYYYDLPVLRTFIGTDIKSLSIIDRDFKTDEIKQERSHQETRTHHKER